MDFKVTEDMWVSHDSDGAPTFRFRRQAVRSPILSPYSRRYDSEWNDLECDRDFASDSDIDEWYCNPHIVHSSPEWAD